MIQNSESINGCTWKLSYPVSVPIAYFQLVSCVLFHEYFMHSEEIGIVFPSLTERVTCNIILYFWYYLSFFSFFNFLSFFTVFLIVYSVLLGRTKCIHIPSYGFGIVLHLNHSLFTLPHTIMHLGDLQTFAHTMIQWNNLLDFPGGTTDETACQCKRHGFDPWSGKIPQALEQLSRCVTTTDPKL